MVWPKRTAAHLERGRQGERAARDYLVTNGLELLTRNYRSPRGEIDLVCWDGDCLAFVEVKTRSSEEWNRPAAAVNARRRRRLSHAALDYLKRIKRPPIRIRFDIIEVLIEKGEVTEIRHLPNAFPLASPYRYY